jgi:hypothetical protein
MTKSAVEVRVHGRGTVRGTTPHADTSVEARCDLCAGVVDAVVSLSPAGQAPFACKACLRERLEAVTVSQWLFQEPGTGLPWGKISG